MLLPASESDPYAGSSPHAETLEQRALTLWQIARGAPDFVLLTSARSRARRLLRRRLARAGAVLKRDEDHSPEELVEKLIASGYMREDPVGAIGEFSIRGGILDVWSPGRPAPVRIEFFGDTVDSIREFDPETQLSTTQLATAEIAPMRELSVTSADFRVWAEFARERWSDERYARALRDRTVFADEGESFAGWEWLMPLVIERNSTVFDYLKDTVFVIDEPSGIESSSGGCLSDTRRSLCRDGRRRRHRACSRRALFNRRRLCARSWMRPNASSCGRWAALPRKLIRQSRSKPKRRRSNFGRSEDTAPAALPFPTGRKRAGDRMEVTVGHALSRAAGGPGRGNAAGQGKRRDDAFCDAQSRRGRTSR